MIAFEFPVPGPTTTSLYSEPLIVPDGEQWYITGVREKQDLVNVILYVKIPHAPPHFCPWNVNNLPFVGDPGDELQLYVDGFYALPGRLELKDCVFEIDAEVGKFATREEKHYPERSQVFQTTAGEVTLSGAEVIRLKTFMHLNAHMGLKKPFESAFQTVLKDKV